MGIVFFSWKYLFTKFALWIGGSSSWKIYPPSAKYRWTVGQRHSSSTSKHFSVLIRPSNTLVHSRRYTSNVYGESRSWCRWCNAINVWSMTTFTILLPLTNPKVMPKLNRAFITENYTFQLWCHCQQSPCFVPW